MKQAVWMAGIVLGGLVQGRVLAEDWAFIDNGKVKLGVDLDRGAGIGYFAQLPEDDNLVDHYDTGRFVQQSYYGDPDGSRWGTRDWVYNPVQGGSSDDTPAALVACTNTGASLYAKVHPRHWGSPPATLLTNVVMEQWITLSNDVAHVRFKMTYADAPQSTSRHQEMPAVFVDDDLNRLVYYRGPSPWTGAELTVTNLPQTSVPQNHYAAIDEHWAAYVNSETGHGIGLYAPGSSLMTYYRVHPGDSGRPSDYACSYFAPLRTFRLSRGLVLDYDIYMKIGSIEAIRSAFAALHADRPEGTPRP